MVRRERENIEFKMNEVYEYIDFRNQVHSTFEKLRRIDKRDIPEVAVREALLNLLVHREYAFRASALICTIVWRHMCCTGCWRR